MSRFKKTLSMLMILSLILSLFNVAFYQTQTEAAETVQKIEAPPKSGIPGAPPNQMESKPMKSSGIRQGIVQSVLQADNKTFSTTVFTFNNIVIFSYFNDTNITVVNESGETIFTGTLAKDGYQNLSVSSGIYRITGTKSFTVLVGDAVTNLVQGYFAVDQSGRGTSTLLNTYVVNYWFGLERFIIFAYEDGTDFTIKDLDSGSLLYAGSLNKGQHFTMPNAPYGKFVQVSANKPVSALSYGDQDYYVPSSNGTFTGTTFYGYSGYIGSWTNSITVTAYQDDTDVTVRNTETGEIISTYKLNAGQVHSDPITSEVYWKVESSKPVTSANIPYAGWSGYYYYMTRAIDQTGIGAGKLFYVPTISSRIDVFSFANNNHVKIIQLGRVDEYPYPNSQVVFDGNLQEGQAYTFTSEYGQYVYKVESTENVSVLQSNGGAGADFMPLSFALQLPDLAISSSDIEFSPADHRYTAGEKITATVTVHNIGPVAASDITVNAYEGDPDGGGVAPVIATRKIKTIDGGGFGKISFSYVVPENPESRHIVIKVDPEDKITESNSSNNKAIKPIIPNKDLLPPLAVNVTAPAGLGIENGNLKPNPFTVTANIFNTGTVPATDVKVELQLFDGLSLNTGDAVTTGIILSPNEQKELKWTLAADPRVSGLNQYKILVGASNVETKGINRSINIPDIVPPAVPIGLTAQATDQGVHLEWKPNMERDLAGYKIYYGTSSGIYDGIGADQGNSPVILSTLNKFDITGLQPNTKYYFAVKAFDTSGNESDYSSEVSSGVSQNQLVSLAASVGKVSAVKALAIPKGKKTQISLKANYQDQTTEDVTQIASWSSENPAIASVENGLITAHAQGKTYISADYKGMRVTISVEINFKNLVATIGDTVIKKPLLLKPGQQQIGLKADYGDGNLVPIAVEAAQWRSNNPEIASVDEKGLITASTKPGKAVITAEYNGKKASIPVEIKLKSLEVTDEGNKVNPIELNQGETARIILKAIYAGHETSFADVAGEADWRSSKKTVATVDENGFITALAKGKATITGKFGGKTVSFTVNVLANVPVDTIKSIQVIDDTYVMAGGGVYTVEAYAPNSDTNLGTGAGKTFVGIYDEGKTSDPSTGGTRQLGAIAAVPVFPSSTQAVVQIDTTHLAAGTYWLRFTTKLADGSWEVAEGVLMVH